MEMGNRHLVKTFVCKKLSLKGFNPNCCTELQAEYLSNGASPTGHVETTVEKDVEQALIEASEEFELRYRKAFRDLTCQLHITPDTAYQSFEQVVQELFRDGTNWGRIVAFFSFGGALCVESANREMEELLPRIIQWMTTYLDTSLEPWIQANGGWKAFVSLYGNDAAAKTRKSQELFGMLLFTGVTLAGLFLLASYMSRR